MTCNWRHLGFARKGSRGFTLVEVLVVMSLLSLIALAMGSALRTTAQTEERVDQKLLRTDEMRVASDFLRGVLGRISAQKAAGPVTAGENPYMFAGAAQELAWIGIMPARYGVGGRFYFRLAVENLASGRALALRYIPWDGANTPPDWSQAETYALVPDAVALEVRYEDAKVEPPEWTPQWVSPDSLPQRVLLSLETTSGPWPDLVVAMRVLPGSDPRGAGGAVFGKPMSLRSARKPLCQAPRGMVLIAVLWMVAALSILVTGITHSVREEARMMSLARQSVVSRALGDAGIHMVLREMVMRTTPISRLTQVEMAYRGVTMQMEIMPLNGLIDINNAPAPLLASLYTVAGGLPPDMATNLAQATVEVRARRNAQGAPERFEASEDLLRVPGFDYNLYAKIFPLITADLRGGGGKVNPMAAPAEVLAVLAGGDASVAARIAASREAGQEGIDTTALEAGFTDNSFVQRFRIQARVPLSDGAWLRVSRSIELDPRGRDGLPWRTFHSQHGVEPVPRKNS